MTCGGECVLLCLAFYATYKTYKKKKKTSHFLFKYKDSPVYLCLTQKTVVCIHMHFLWIKASIEFPWVLELLKINSRSTILIRIYRHTVLDFRTILQLKSSSPECDRKHLRDSGWEHASFGQVMEKKYQLNQHQKWVLLLMGKIWIWRAASLAKSTAVKQLVCMAG